MLLEMLLTTLLKFHKIKDFKLFNQNNKIFLNISDDGDGFPEDVIQKLGDPYIKSNVISENKRGLGLGVFISKTLLERTNAEVSFKESPELGGASVVIAWKETDLLNNLI